MKRLFCERLSGLLLTARPRLPDMESTNPLPVDGGIGRRRLPDGRDAEAAPDLVNQAFWWGEVTDVRLHYAQARNRTDRAAQLSSEVLLWGCEAGAGCYGGGCRAGGLVVVIVVVLLVEKGFARRMQVFGNRPRRRNCSFARGTGFGGRQYRRRRRQRGPPSSPAATPVASESWPLFTGAETEVAGQGAR